MFEHVRNPGFALGIVHRTGIDIGMERDHRGRMPLQHNKVEAVGQGEFRDVFFEFFQILGGNTRRQGKGKEDLFHKKRSLPNVADESAGYWKSEATTPSIKKCAPLLPLLPPYSHWPRLFLHRMIATSAGYGC